jgi:hypothetical protein
MSRHVSAEKLARFRDGDLGRAATRRVSAHLAGCAACQADAEALAGLPALLAAAELPPIPDHLAARIETALATEAVHRAAGSPALGPARLGRSAHPAHPARPAGTRDQRRPGHPRWLVTDEHARRAAWPARRILAAAAAVAVLGGGGYALASNWGGGGVTGTSSASSADGSRAAASPANAPAPAAAPRASEFAPAVPGAAASVPAGALTFGSMQQYRADGHAGSFTPVRTSTAYVAAKLGHQATAALTQVRSSRPPPGGLAGGHTSSGAGPGRTVTNGLNGAAPFSAATLARLRGCVARVAAGQSVLLVDVASFEGGPATIIATAPPGAAVATQVWAVGPGCSSSSADVLAHQRLP